MKYGFVDVARFQILKLDNPNVRTYINGEDITMRCRWANDETGEALCLLLRDGQTYVDEGTESIAVEMLHGTVEFK